MKIVSYPLGHLPSELERLDDQALLLHDPFLDQLAQKSTSCLEIGCGSGSNVLLIKRVNPRIAYTGVDISIKAIEAAKTKYDTLEDVTFLVGDATSINMKEQFDLIFTKLVLWSVGEQWKEVIRKAKKMLKHGGTFYALEPYNRLIQFYPPKPCVQQWMKKWDEAAIYHGLNPHIGIEIASELVKTGLVNVGTHFFPVAAMGVNREKYSAIIKNLTGFYLGPAAQQFGLETPNNHILDEFQRVEDANFIMDSLFVAWGQLDQKQC